MAENSEYYQELVAKQQELLVTLFSPKKQINHSGEIEKLKKRLCTFSQLIASTKRDIRLIQKQLSEIQAEVNYIKNEVIMNKITNEDFSFIEKQPEEITQSREIPEPIYEESALTADTVQDGLDDI